MKIDKKHIEMRNRVENLMHLGVSIERISQKLGLPVGTRFIKKSAKWYRYCIRAKANQKKAIEKHPGLYSKAGKIAQQKHPWLSYRLGKKYGPIQGNKNKDRLKGNSRYFSMMARKLQEIDPRHSKRNMKKAHETMKRKGTFNKHQKEAALMCMEKHPHQLKEMSKKAHELYPLALMALESNRKRWPYEFMGCLFDSESERRLCETFIENGLMTLPIEKKNVHYRIDKCHIDFFIKNKVFVEYHPPASYNGKHETVEEYYNQRRKILDKNGYQEYPLIVIDRLKPIKPKIEKIRKLLSFKFNK